MNAHRVLVACWLVVSVSFYYLSAFTDVGVLVHGGTLWGLALVYALAIAACVIAVEIWRLGVARWERSLVALLTLPTAVLLGVSLAFGLYRSAVA